MDKVVIQWEPFSNLGWTHRVSCRSGHGAHNNTSTYDKLAKGCVSASNLPTSALEGSFIKAKAIVCIKA